METPTHPFICLYPADRQPRSFSIRSQASIVQPASSASMEANNRIHPHASAGAHAGLDGLGRDPWMQSTETAELS